MRPPDADLEARRTRSMFPALEPPRTWGTMDDDGILRALGYDPARHYVEHCAHCDRWPVSGRHPSCIVREIAQPERGGA